MKILFVILCLFSVSSWAQIGTVSDNKGTGCEIVRGKQKLSGTKGSGVESMDTYVTTNCSSKITFKDDTKVNVTENSRLLIDDFVFDPKKSDAGKLTMKVAMGTVRYASGQVAKNNPQNVNIQTPTATIAVRGTDFNMTVDEAGQSLIILVPSCKDDRDVKKYELEENKCRVGKIIVETLVGKVTLEEAFMATYVQSSSMAPTPPTIVNTIESKINNNLILVIPQEVQKSIKDVAGKTKKEMEDAEAEADSVRRMNERLQQSAEAIEKARVMSMVDSAAKRGCNSTTHICINWDKPDAERPSAGKGVAFRIQPNEHYAEVKTQGFQSNTAITITQNDTIATELIGSGDAGGNVVSIKQNTGVLRRP
jgi:hypothetical protein